MNDLPPKIQNLLYFIEKLKLDIPGDLLQFVATLNSVSVPTRYPDNLERLLRDFTQARTMETLKKGKDVLQWIKAIFVK